MQARISMMKPSVRPSVCVSVCLPVKHVNGDKTKETYAKILTPQEKTIVSVLRQEKNGWWGRPLVHEILRETDNVRVKTPIFN